MNKFLSNKNVVMEHGMTPEPPRSLKLWQTFGNIFFCWFMLIFSTEAIAQVKIVRDIQQTSELERFTEIVGFQNKSFFITDHEPNGFEEMELWVSDGTEGGTYRLKQFTKIKGLTVSGSYLYFTASEILPECRFNPEPCSYADNGMELWRTDGTWNGTILVKDINPGTTGSNPEELTDVNGKLYFVATGPTGRELYSSNGTATGTTVVKEIMNGVGGSNPHDLVAMNNTLYFTANDSATGYELWKSDGTAAGTVRVVDIAPGSRISSNPKQTVAANGKLFFFATDGVNGRQLWMSNGSTGNATLLKVIPGSNKLDLLTSVDTRVFFQADDGTHGAELWTSDGTTAGTILAKDITPGPGSATGYASPHLRDLREANGKLYFLAWTSEGYALWVSDGTQAGTIKLTNRSEVGFGHGDGKVVEFKGEAYFCGVVERELAGYYEFHTVLWKTDGTVEGTEIVKRDVSGGEYVSNFIHAVSGNYLFFTGYDAIWRTDGTTAGTEKILELNAPASSEPKHLTDVNGSLYFEAKLNSSYQLWKSQGTAETTDYLMTWYRYVRDLKNIDGKLYFSAYDYRHGEPWKSDGTVEGTSIIKDIAVNTTGLGIRGSDPSEFTAFNNQIYFRAAPTSADPYGLFKTDGSEAGTTSVKLAGADFQNPSSLTVAGNKLFFLAENSTNGSELWKSDGTPAGTTLVKDIKPGAASSGAIRFTPFKGQLYFQADDGVSGYELWKSNGTAAGTFRMKNIRGNDNGSLTQLGPLDMGNMITTTDYLYFVAQTAAEKSALWKTDGTPVGTTLVTTFEGNPKAHIIGTLGEKIIYALMQDRYLEDFGRYTELWISDGTAAGTTLIGRGGALQSIVTPYEVAKLNNVLYFIGSDGEWKGIWRTDGTPGGTYQIIVGGEAHELETSGGIVYTSADTYRYGWELFYIDDPGPTTTMASTEHVIAQQDALFAEEAFSTSYPNPFASSFVLRVNGGTGGTFQLNVTSMDGKTEQHFLEYNTDHVLGQTWKAGMYILRVYDGKRSATHKLIKQAD